MSAATAAGRPSPAQLDQADDLLDQTAAAKEHRLSGRWADAEGSQFPKFTAWRITLRLSRGGLAAQLDVSEDLVRRIEDGQSPNLRFIGNLASVFRLTREQALDLFSVNGKPVL